MHTCASSRGDFIGIGGLLEQLAPPFGNRWFNAAPAPIRCVRYDAVMDGFRLEGSRAGDWRIPAALLSLAGFGLALAVLYGSFPAVVWTIPLVLLALESLRRWYASPCARLVVDAEGVRYGFDETNVVTPWFAIRGFEKRQVSEHVLVFLISESGETLPIDPQALGVGSDELLRLLNGCRRASATRGESPETSGVPNG